jgi:glucose-6-phosphate isomerase
MYFNHFQSLNNEAKRVRASKPLLATRELHTEYLSLDVSRQWLDPQAEMALTNHATQVEFDAWRVALAEGKIVNITEQQPATHMYCRWAVTESLNGVGEQPLFVSHQVYIQQCLQFAEQFRAGQLTGATGKILTHYVHLGIGGSDLGPRCVVQALNGLPNINTADTVSFISNLDPDDFFTVVRHLNPETTLFGVASKSFNTLETQANAKLAQAWLKDAFKRLNGAGLNQKNIDISAHFCAMTASPDKASAFLGFSAEQASTRILPIPPTVGGRYSLWSAIGLPIAIAFGREVFVQLCEGATSIDKHFLNTPFSENLPAQLGAIQVECNRFRFALSANHCV